MLVLDDDVRLSTSHVSASRYEVEWSVMPHFGSYSALFQAFMSEWRRCQSVDSENWCFERKREGGNAP